MRIAVTLVIEMTDQQVERWASDNGLERTESGRVMAKTVVEDIRSYILTLAQGELSVGEYAEVSIKR